MLINATGDIRRRSCCSKSLTLIKHKCVLITGRDKGHIESLEPFFRCRVKCLCRDVVTDVVIRKLFRMEATSGSKTSSPPFVAIATKTRSFQRSASPRTTVTISVIVESNQDRQTHPKPEIRRHLFISLSYLSYFQN